MNSVERVKAICKERKIPISRLEKDLGYANGYVSQLRKGVFPGDRLAEIAKYLSVSATYLLTGETEKPAIQTDSGLHVETAYDLLTPQNKEKIRIQIVSLLKQQSDS